MILRTIRSQNFVENLLKIFLRKQHFYEKKPASMMKKRIFDKKIPQAPTLSAGCRLSIHRRQTSLMLEPSDISWTTFSLKQRLYRTCRFRLFVMFSAIIVYFEV
jgi:hypothetical protein